MTTTDLFYLVSWSFLKSLIASFLTTNEITRSLNIIFVDKKYDVIIVNKNNVKASGNRICYKVICPN